MLQGARQSSEGEGEFVVRNRGRVTRFVVMAVLQAARARTLGLPQESAYSWGLNRAIFYAAAKRGFRGSGTTSGTGPDGTPGPSSREPYRLGDEQAFRNPETQQLLFRIGDEDQTVPAFEREIETRFGTKANFQAAWDEAMRIVARYDRSTLESRRGFYEEVYRPRRDELSDTWTNRYCPAPKAAQ